MNVLLNLELEDRHIRQIRAVSNDLELVQLQSEGEILEAMPDVHVVFGELSREMFIRGDKLRWVQQPGAGVDARMFAELVESDVVLTSEKGTVGVHLAEHAIALMLALTRGIATAIRKPGWEQRMPIRNAAWELIGMNMGIVGLGGTGRDLAHRAHAFGMAVVAVDPEDVDVPESVEACWEMDCFYELLERSDVVAICAPLTAETEGMFDEKAFARMRSHALLINVARGKIVNENALMDALEKGEIGGAGLDVTPQEPLPDEHQLWRMHNVIITPHVAGGSPNRRDRLVQLFCENLRRILASEPLLSVIDKRKGY